MKKFFPLADCPTVAERRKLGLADKGGRQNVRAVMKGEMRFPKAGEWYLSGAIVEAYRAPNDFGSPYMIARLVRVKVTTTTTIEEVR